MPRNPLEIDLNDPDVQQLIVSGKHLHLGTVEGEMARNRQQLVPNLTAMVALVQASGAQAVLMTYPSNWGFYPGANRRITEAAGALDVPLIELTPLFIERCPDGPASCAELMFEDGHPRAAGYALVAAEIARALRDYQLR